MEERSIFKYNAEATGHHIASKKNKQQKSLNLSLIIFIEINTKWFVDLNVNMKLYKHLERKEKNLLT